MKVNTNMKKNIHLLMITELES